MTFDSFNFERAFDSVYFKLVYIGIIVRSMLYLTEDCYQYANTITQYQCYAYVVYLLYA